MGGERRFSPRFPRPLQELHVATLETNDDGGLHLPPELIGGARPHAKFEIEGFGGIWLLRPADKERPFWRGNAATTGRVVQTLGRLA